jgi:outer membrane protein
MLLVDKAASQVESSGKINWTVKTRILMTGSSDRSDPNGYLVYSAITIEPSINRKINSNFSIDLNFRTESHEVDYTSKNEFTKDSALGSIELIPINLLVQYNFLISASQFYVAAGGNATFCWEKSGALNPTDLTPGVGPSLQIGFDQTIHENLLLNLNIGWNSRETNIKIRNTKIARLEINPVALGIGLGYKF